MKLENQVTSLEISRQMKDAGFAQDTQWQIAVFSTGNHIMTLAEVRDEGTFGVLKREIEHYAVYSVAELGEILPCGYYTVREGGEENYFVCWTRDGKKCTNSKDEADARGKMALYLRKEGLL